MMKNDLSGQIMKRLDRGPATRDEIYSMGADAPDVARKLVKEGKIHFNRELCFQRVSGMRLVQPENEND